MIRTHVLPCRLPRPVADAINLASGAIYTGMLVRHWRVVRHHGHWLSEKSGTRWSDLRLPVKPLHAHSIDAAQQGFYNACRTTRALRKASRPDAKFPHWRKRSVPRCGRTRRSKKRMRSSRCPTGKATSRSPLHCLRRWPMCCVSWKSAWSSTGKPAAIPGMSSSKTGSNPRQPRAPTW